LGGLYRRAKVLGQSSFGKAFLVRNTEAEELCAVKRMATSMTDPKRRVEAVKGAILLMSKDHKYTIHSQVVCMTGKGRLCIVMDFADGGDVRRAIMSREGGRLPEPQILEWFARTRLALKGPRDRRVLRRDLEALDISSWRQVRSSWATLGSRGCWTTRGTMRIPWWGRPTT
jgi:NIMA (never in mitosis gene a)-related kinase